MGENIAGEVAGAIGHGAPVDGQVGAIPVMDEWTSNGSDMYLPGPIGTKDIAIISRILAVNEDSRPILEALHTDYITSFNDLNNTVIKKVQEASQAQWKNMGTAQQEWVPLTEEGVAAVYGARKRVARINQYSRRILLRKHRFGRCC